MKTIDLYTFLTRFVQAHIYKTIVRRNIDPMMPNSIRQKQHDFFKRRSTINLAVFINYVLNNMQLSRQIDVFYTDFEKAFHRVNYVTLLETLESHVF